MSKDGRTVADGHTRKKHVAPSLPGLAPRMAAVRLLAAVIDTRTALDGLTDDTHGHPQYLALEPRDRSLARAILQVALRHRPTIEGLIAKGLDRPLPSGATALNHILHVGAAQLLWLAIPDSAAVNLAVEHAKSDPRTRRFAALVNAVLRGIARGQKGVTPMKADLPPWFEKRLVSVYGESVTALIAERIALPAPVDFSVKSDPQRWAHELGGIVLPTGGVRVARPSLPVPQLPGFAEGAWWVQDVASAIPALLFGGIRGQRIADLCAAPGGKTAQLVLAGAHVTAVEKSASRLKRLKGNLERLAMTADLVAADLFAFAPTEPFDGVLLDAPCSSTGTIRRHPDVLWTKTADDIARLAALQERMLKHAATLVRPGGIIVFSNCSLDPDEGEAMIARFLANHPDMRVEPAGQFLPESLAFAVTPEGYVRTTPAALDLGTPELSGMDGFFAVRMKMGK